MTQLRRACCSSSSRGHYDKITPAGSYASKALQPTELYLSGTWKWLNVKYSRAMTDVGYFGFNSNNAGPGAFPAIPARGDGQRHLGLVVHRGQRHLRIPARLDGLAHAGRQTITHPPASATRLQGRRDQDHGRRLGAWSATYRDGGHRLLEELPQRRRQRHDQDMGAGTWIASVNRTF